MRKILLLLLVIPSVCLAQVPQAAHKYRADLVRASHLVWGLNAPIPAFAAQVHQESGWRPDVCSPYACGLTQFTADTADWIQMVYGVELGPKDRFHPVWALRAMVRYNKHLYDQTPGHTQCDRMWATLRKYNGGPGHWNMESRFAVDRLDRAEVDKTCGQARRSVKHCPENLGYPKRILERIQPRYESWGQYIHCN
jgi:hypothetical protein